eukprot:4096813-Prymnesium_polylepis.1
MPRLSACDGCLARHGLVVTALRPADTPRCYRRGRECTRDASGIAVPSPRAGDVRRLAGVHGLSAAVCDSILLVFQCMHAGGAIRMIRIFSVRGAEWRDMSAAPCRRRHSPRASAPSSAG